MSKNLPLIALLFLAGLNISLSVNLLNQASNIALQAEVLDTNTLIAVGMSFSLSYLLLIPFAGRVTDKTGCQPILMVSMLLQVILSLSKSIFDINAFALIMQNTLAGLSCALFYCGAFKAIAVYFMPQYRGQVLTIALSGSYLPVFYFTVFPLTHFTYWSAIFTLLALFSFLLMWGFLRLRPGVPDATARASSPLQHELHTLKNPVLIPYAFGLFVICMAIQAFNYQVVQSPYYTSTEPIQLGLILSVVASIIAIFSIGLLVRKKSSLYCAQLGAACCVLFIITAVTSLWSESETTFIASKVGTTLFSVAVLFTLQIWPLVHFSANKAGAISALIGFVLTLGLLPLPYHLLKTMMSGYFLLSHKIFFVILAFSSVSIILYWLKNRVMK